MPPNGIRAMQQNGTLGTATLRTGTPSKVSIQAPWLARFFGKLVHDVLPAALASLIGGFLFTQYHYGQAASPRLVDVQPASPQMMAMVRDEHALIINYLKAQMAAERRRDQAEDAANARAVAEARATADAKLADALFASQAMAAQNAVSAAPAKAAPARHKAPPVLAAAPHAPLTIAQADPPPNETAAGAATAGEETGREPDALLANPFVAKTLDIKDHVVAATRQVVSVIGKMFASVGDSLGGTTPGNRQFNSAS
ncbi:MAG TPA: hypothetical protein VL048_17365 [Xanthobacteraceae bacterium]|nr:hypothetical protein [Xanthobacteraceae bacterium]